MCPVCVANIAWIAAGAIGSGGLTLAALTRILKQKKMHQPKGKEDETSRE